MLKGHPKGLLIAFFANMGERFGFYTMMAILVLFLQAKFGLTSENAGIIYSVFYALIYALALVGGIVADRFAGLKKTITIGIVTMALGYVLIAIPDLGLPAVCTGLFIIAFGNGLFKGNLQAVVGNLYEAEKYSHLRDSAFSVFYMGINVGALFAPTVAIKIRDYILLKHGFHYDGDLPGLCHKLLDGEDISISKLQSLADNVNIAGNVTDLKAFANQYIEAFSTGYNYAFGFAAIMMLVSLVIYFMFNSKLKEGFTLEHKEEVASVDNTSKAQPSKNGVTDKDRLLALIMVFAVVIFFWMSFHQNGLTLTFFARDYVSKSAAPSTFFWFDLSILLPWFGAILGLATLIKRGSTPKNRIIGLLAVILLGGFGIWRYNTIGGDNTISPETFQHMNPFFIVSLTPIVVAFFSWLNKKGMEPSAPRKIGIGMFLAAAGFIIMMIASFGLIAPHDIHDGGAPLRVTPYWLIGTYFTLTIAELFLSPMGISFVSKVAPAKYKGIMQGGWLCATAIGNQLLFMGSFLWEKVELWQLWGFFVLCCIISGCVIFSIMKRLERVTSAS